MKQSILWNLYFAAKCVPSRRLRNPEFSWFSGFWYDFIEREWWRVHPKVGRRP